MDTYIRYSFTRLFFLLSMFGSQQYIYAQQEKSSLNTCVQEAEISFRRGNPEIAIQSVEDCLGNSRKAQKSDLIDAYRLLSLAYLENNQRPQAEEVFQKLLSLNPEFDISALPSEDADLLMLLYQSFRIDPIFFGQVHVGTNFSQVDVLQQFGASNSALVSSKEDYSTSSGFQTGIQFSLPIKNRNLRLVSGLSFTTRSYNHSDTLQTSTTDSLNFATLTNQETQSIFQLPLLLSVDFDKWNAPNYQKNTWVPFVYGGLSLDYLISSQMNDISRINTIGASENGLSRPEIRDMRKRLNSSLILGGGFKYKVGLSYIVIDLRYTQGMNNLVNPDTRYTNRELLYLFGYVDDDFRMRTYSISIGIEKAFYKPKKWKK